MVDDGLLPCPRCGGKANMWWGSCEEIGGELWQKVYVECTGTTPYWCNMALTISVENDANKDRLISAANRVAREAWNSLARCVEVREEG